MNRRTFVAAAAGAAGALHSLAARAQGLETLRLLCGYPAGGTSDAVARRVAEKLQGSYARVALVENKAGASGRLAVDELNRSPSDGSVMLLTPASVMSLYPHIYTRLSYRPQELTPVGTACRFTYGFGVGPAVPQTVKSLKDFGAWARANPDQANFGTPGNGSPLHFLGALLGRELGIELRHVPYRGSAPGIQDLLGGQLQAMCSPLGDYLPYVKDGKLRLLATSGSTRSQSTPEVATFADQGFKELVMAEYYEVFMPPRASPAAVQRAAQALKAAVSAPDVVEAFAKVGLESVSVTPDELARIVRDETARWGPIVKRIGFTPEN